MPQFISYCKRQREKQGSIKHRYTDKPMRSKLIKLSASICWINPYKQVGRGALGNAVSAVHLDTASVQYETVYR